MDEIAPMQAIAESYGLGTTQEGMLFHALTYPGSGVDIEQIIISMQEPLRADVFARAWQAVIERHAILRTRFRWEDVQSPVQDVMHHAVMPIRTLDWSGLGRTEVDVRLESWLEQDRSADFSMDCAPLMRMTLMRIAEDEWRAVWTFHHALLDGRSFPLVLREVFFIYGELCRGEALSLPPPRLFRDYIEWLKSRDFAASEAYWRETLAGFTAPTPLPGPRLPGERKAIGGVRGSCEARLSSDITRKLRALASEFSITVNTLLQGAWALLLHRYTGESDVVFGATRACRRSSVEHADERVGLFINTLPVRVRVPDSAVLGDWLRELREQQLAVRSHEHTPLVKVQGWSHVPRGTPLFDTLLVFENRTLGAQLRDLGGDWGSRDFVYRGQTNYPLALIAYGDDELLLQLEFSRHQYLQSTVGRMLGHLVTVLEGMVANPHVTLGELPLLPEAEWKVAVAGAGGTQSYPRGLCLHERFERQARSTPDATAVVFEERHITYRELNGAANRIAHRLSELGVQPGHLVGLRCERSAELVTGILGILKAGAAYLPMDPVYPKDRMAFMLEDAKVAVVLTQKSLADDLDGLPVRHVLLDEPLTTPDTDPGIGMSPDALAYVIYTSGSTGKPKGALVSHYNVMRLFEATDAWYRFNERDVWTLFHSYAFDFSVWEIWGALLYGGRVVVVPYWVSRSPDSFHELLVRERVTVLNQTPSAFRQLVQADLARPKSDLALRYVIFGGEALELQSLRPWFERYGDDQPLLVNMYGITETTVHVTYRPIRMVDLQSGQGSVIGVPIPDLKILILDSNFQPVPEGVVGEMYVGGAGVAEGYLNRPELTAQRFIAHPFAEGERLYRTGDLARRLDNGDLEYLGRVDHQVKIRGFRIELGEIEAGIAQHSKVREVSVVVREDVPGDKRLVAYIAAECGDEALIGQLRESLSAIMPIYMIPSHFVLMDALPLTPNGKVDRKALPAPSTTRAGLGKDWVAPTSNIERILVEVWQAVLNVTPIGIHNNFFEMGGDSILSIQVIARCRTAGVQITPRDLFKYPTVAQLAQVATQIAARQAVVAEAAGAVPLTPIERWFFEQEFVQRNHWNQAFLFEVPAQFDVVVLEQALGLLVRHHDALRLRFTCTATGWLQEYAVQPQLLVRSVDLTREPAASRAMSLAMHAEQAQRSLDIEQGRLLCAVHFTMGLGEPGRLLLVVHHLAVDGVSWRLLREDLESLYSQLVAGRSPALPAKTTSYQTWAATLDAYAQSGDLQKARSYWTDQASKPVSRLPAVGLDTENLESSARSVKVFLDKEETRALLQQAPAAYRTQINDMLLTALAQALQAWSGQTAFVVDLEGHGREDLFEGVDLSRTVGWFTTLFPVRLDLAPGVGPGGALQSIKQQLRTLPQRGLSYGVLRYATADTATRQALAQAPRAELLFNYLGQFDQVVAGSSLFRFAREATGPWHGQQSRRTHALEVLCVVREGRLEAEWIHNPRIHSGEAIGKLAEDFVRSLQALISHCLSPSAGGRTPADFPLATLAQPALDALWSRYPGFEDLYPLSPMQRLFYAMEGAQTDLGFEQWHFRASGRIDPLVLRQAIDRTIARHPILRTAFISFPDAEPHQIVLSEAAVGWAEEDWRALSGKEQEMRLSALLSADKLKGFDTAKAPLMRVSLCRVQDEDYHLIWSTHHLYIDGWSWPLVFREVSQCYLALRQNSEPELAPVCEYRKYLSWLHDRTPDSARFWKERLAGVSSPTPFVLSDLPQGQGKSSTAPGQAGFQLDEQVTASLQKIARSQQMTASTLVQAAWSILLSHYSGLDDVVFGAAFSGRPAELPGVESLIGPCVNNLPVRVVLNQEESLLALLGRMHQEQFDLTQHQYSSVAEIQEYTDVPWRWRLFDSLIVFQNYQVDAEARRIGQDAELQAVDTPQATNYPLTITVHPGERFDVQFAYQAQRLQPQDVDAFVADMKTVLQAMVAQPDQSITVLRNRLPQSSQGKAKRSGASQSREPSSPYLPPKTEMERSIAELWQELFGAERISLDDNFFDLGGHSLLLVQAHVRLCAQLKRNLPIVTLLQYPTIRALARHLSGGSESSSVAQAAQDRARKQQEALRRQRNPQRGH